MEDILRMIYQSRESRADWNGIVPPSGGMKCQCWIAFFRLRCLSCGFCGFSCFTASALGKKRANIREPGDHVPDDDLRQEQETLMMNRPNTSACNIRGTGKDGQKDTEGNGDEIAEEKRQFWSPRVTMHAMGRHMNPDQLMSMNVPHVPPEYPPVSLPPQPQSSQAPSSALSATRCR